MRVPGAARISHETDASTSVERQREVISLTCQARGDQLVAITEDADVSGAISPFERPDLGPWLAKPDQWDAIMVAKLDRLTRSLRDFDDFRQWCDTHGKVIISISESLDPSTVTGRMSPQLRDQYRTRGRRSDHAPCFPRRKLPSAQRQGLGVRRESGPPRKLPTNQVAKRFTRCHCQTGAWV